MYYALTIVKNTHPVWIEDYETYIDALLTKFRDFNIEYCYEYKPTTGALHVHALVTDTKERKRPVNKYALNKKGYSIDWEPVDNLRHWTRYYRKNLNQQQQILEYEHKIYKEFLEFQKCPQSLSSSSDSSSSPSSPEIPKPTNLKTFDIRNCVRTRI